MKSESGEGKGCEDKQDKETAEAEIAEAKVEIAKAEEELAQAERMYYRQMSYGLVGLLVVLFLGLELILFKVLLGHTLGKIPSSRSAVPLCPGGSWDLGSGELWNVIALSALYIIPFWILALGIAVSLYHFLVRPPLERAKAKLKALEAEQQTRDESSLRSYLEGKLRWLYHNMARVFLESPDSKRYDAATRARRAAESLLGQKPPKLNEAHAQVSYVYELVQKEEGELKAQRTWRYLATGVIFVYIALLVFMSRAYAAQTQASEPVLVLGIPQAVVMWAAAGSLAAILYKLYKQEERVRLDREIRWLIARPVIGIVMGGLAYLAISSGLVLLGVTPASDAQGVTQVGRQEAYWAIAFIAGFSDRFYEGLIELLVGTVGDPRKDGKDTEEKEQKRKARR